ncbi:MAG TPA: hypothetical protein VMP89_18600 [Solirubrobacteraceae bacterium]|nr:hypothetical protein [Solirubrobacteraceae bacterium]
MTAFFVPGVAGDTSVESVYEDMRKRTELDMGRRPSGRRILSVWARRGSLDCVTEVGRRDPLHGGTVIAIFDMGPHQPFVLWREQDDDKRLAASELLGARAYAVMEFDR